MKMHRAQILLEPQQHRVLRDIARRQGRSISAVVRDLISNQLIKLKEEQDNQTRHHLAVIDHIKEHKRLVLTRRGKRPIAIDIAKIIERNRDERDGNIIDADQPFGRLFPPWRPSMLWL